MFRSAFKSSALSPRPLCRNVARSIVARNARPTDAPKHEEATSFESPPPYLNIKLPDLSAPPPESEVHIPFTPDFWESSRAKAEAARALLLEEPQIPKVIVVAGDLARADSAHIIPEHASVEHHPAAYSAEPASVPEASNLRNLFLDVADDLMLPKDLSALKHGKGQLPLGEDLFEELSTSTGTSKFHFRTLDKNQVRGVWVIVGLFAGSWLAGGLLKKNSKYAESE